MIEILARILSMPIPLLSAIFLVPFYFLLDFIFHVKITARNIVFYLLSGAVFIYLAYGENLTIGLGLLLIIPLSILSDLLANALFKEENGDGNG